MLVSRVWTPDQTVATLTEPSGVAILDGMAGSHAGLALANH